jgi:2-dehydro-3-deoxyphosphogluconate aldolase/(4S)-4-hydroxy-2-oxoglutarate aldolase
MLEASGVIPVIKIDRPQAAAALGKALLNGGIPVAEVTFRTDAAGEAIGILSDTYPQLLVGAGTVLSIEKVDRAVGAGAKFIVSPGLNPEVVQYCKQKSIPVIPGCCTPSDIEKALSLGLDTVKFFPAEACGGLNMLRALSAPYPAVKYIPTGGIDPKNLSDYLSFSKVLACGGSWMVRDELINQGRFDEIARLCREAVQLVLGFELAHIGINAKSEEDALETAGWFSAAFAFPVKDGANSCFSGSDIEIVKGKGGGSHGHIAIKTNHIKSAAAYLNRQGFETDMSTAKCDSTGRMTALYLREEIGGFAVHLLQK